MTPRRSLAPVAVALLALFLALLALASPATLAAVPAAWWWWVVLFAGLWLRRP
jgi:hypothetical protein